MPRGCRARVQTREYAADAEKSPEVVVVVQDSQSGRWFELVFDQGQFSRTLAHGEYVTGQLRGDAVCEP